jgi:hypothetical protein
MAENDSKPAFPRRGDEQDAQSGEPSTAHEEQQQFRGMLGDVCSNAVSNSEHPELCGTEEPIVDEHGRPLRPDRYHRKVTED